MLHDQRLLIDGKLVDAEGGRTYENVNPATEEVLGVAADGSAGDVDRAIGAARTAFDTTSWSTDLDLRVRCLRQLHAAMLDEVAGLRELTVAEVGSPAALTTGPQVDTPIEFLSYYADVASTYPWAAELPYGADFGSRRWVEKEAVGVVGAITPWNFPTQITLAKLAPALAAGNTVVLKVAPDTPWSGSVLGRIMAERTDIPPGVVNVITSSRKDIGEVITTDPRVDLVSFTGSTATGRRIMAACSATVKRVFLELGGKSAFVVLDDADFAGSIPVAALQIMVHAGQGCAITTRLLLPRSRFDEGVEVARATMASLAYGDPTRSDVLMGPLINAVQRDRVLGYVRTGLDAGARLVLGGGRPAELPVGYYVEPTLLVESNPASRVAQEEIFGPVLVAIPFEDDDDAVRIANGTIFGLSGAVAGGDPERATAVARRLRTGTVGINGGQWYGAEVPFGGYGQSGIGREMGLPGFEEYLESKSLAILAPRAE